MSSNNPLIEYLNKNNDGRLIDRWTHYFDIYHRHFSRFRGMSITIIEIGVYNGGSLRMWRDYFGEKSTIVGVDINPECRLFAEPGIDIVVGDQGDREFLRVLADRYPGFSILIDDGGHRMHQQIATFEELYLRMDPAGIYLCEDTHTSYWPEFGGGYKQSQSFIECIKPLIDRLNAFHSLDTSQLAPDIFTRSTDSIHIYDSVVVFEKRPRQPPQRIYSGKIAPFRYIGPSISGSGISNTRFHIVRISINNHDVMYEEIIRSLIFGFRELGHECTMAVNHIAEDAINILVGSTMFAARALRLSDRLRDTPYIVYQLEPLDDLYGDLPDWPEYGALLSRASFIWDYSPSGTTYLRNRDFPPVSYLPPAYHPTLETFRPLAACESDVLFLGSSHPRRLLILNALREAGARVMHIEGCYGRQRDEALARAKIILNIHASDDLKTLETVRLSYLLANGCFVISEGGNHNPYDNGVVYADYPELVGTCLDWLRRPASERGAVAGRGYQAVRREWMTDWLQRALSDSFVTRDTEGRTDTGKYRSVWSGSLMWPVPVGEDFAALDPAHEALRSAFAIVPEAIDPDEGLLLYRWSREGSGLGSVLQAGDFPASLGIWLAAGCRDAGRGHVIIDGIVPKTLHRALAEQGLDRSVDVWRGEPEQLNVRLLVLGGRASYEECRKAMTYWLGRVENCGAVAVHGVGLARGATQLHDEILRSNRAVREVCRVGSVSIFGAR